MEENKKEENSIIRKKGGLAGKILFLLAMILFCSGMREGKAMAAAVHTIPSNDLSVIKSASALQLNSSTFSSYQYNGVKGRIVEGTNSDLYMTVPCKTTTDSFTYTDLLDLNFKNAGSIGGRKINAALHFDSLTVSPPPGSYTGLNQEGTFAFCQIDTSGIWMIGWSSSKALDGNTYNYAGAKEIRTSITFTYADTGESVELPFFQLIGDIDVYNSDYGIPESWQGEQGYSGDIYKYNDCELDINGMKVSCKTDGADHSTNGDDSYTRGGCYVVTDSGRASMVWQEAYCNTEMKFYSAYLDDNLQSPVKSVASTKTYEPGEEVTWRVSQKISTFYGNTFTKYRSFQFKDTLPPEVTYQSAKVLAGDVDVTKTYGTLQYDSSTRTVTYTLKGNILGSEAFYDGKTLTLEMKTTARNSTKNVITARNTGVTNIDGIVKSSQEVSVHVNPLFHVTTEIENGTITEPAINVPIRADRTVTWKAKDGCYVESVMVDGAEQTVKQSDGDSYTFSNITADHHVKVVCKPYHQITAEISNGTITEKIVSIKNGESHTVTWKAKEGCYVESVTVDGTEQTVKQSDGDSYTFSNITADHHVKVVCKPYHQITTEISNGTITEKIVSIKNGESHTVTWKAKDGYYVESVTVDDHTQAVKIDAGDCYAFSDIASDHHVKVVCKPYYKIDTEIDHGTITPDQDNVKEGGEPVIVWEPEAGYYVKSVTVDDTIVYRKNSTKFYDTEYTFAPVSENHRIVVKTALIPSLKITKTSDKKSYNYQETITYTITAEQTVKGAVADHVIITDKDITKGAELDLETIKVSDPSARIEKDEAGHSFLVKLEQMLDTPVTITVKARVNNDKLDCGQIKNTARIVSDQTDEITDDSDISVYYKVNTRVTNGSITPDDEKVGRGENRTISFRPKDDSYYLESVKIDGELQNLGDCPGKVELNDIRANYFIEVVYKKIPDLTIQKTADRKTYSSGDVVTYTIKVSQPVSDGVAENVVIADESLPDGVTLIGDSVSCNESMAQIKVKENTFRVLVPRLAAGKTVTVTGKALIVGKKLKSGTILNTAEASFKNAEGVEGSRKASCQVLVKQKIITEVVNGSITDSTGGITLHTDREVTYQADKGYYLESVTVDGEKISITDYPDKYEFQDIYENHTIKAVYKKIPVLGISKTSDKDICNVNDNISFVVKVSQLEKEAAAENVVITDKEMTAGLKIRPDTFTVYGVDSNDYKLSWEEGGGFTLLFNRKLRESETVLVTYDVLIEDPALAGKDIYNSAEVKCDHSDQEEKVVWQGKVLSRHPAETQAAVPEKTGKVTEPTPVSSAAKEDKPEKISVQSQEPETGDQFPLAGVVVLFLISFCAAIWTRKKRRKDGGNSNG